MSQPQLTLYTDLFSLDESVPPPPLATPVKEQRRKITRKILTEENREKSTEGCFKIWKKQVQHKRIN